MPQRKGSMQTSMNAIRMNTPARSKRFGAFGGGAIRLEPATLLTCQFLHHIDLDKHILIQRDAEAVCWAAMTWMRSYHDPGSPLLCR